MVEGLEPRRRGEARRARETRARDEDGDRRAISTMSARVGVRTFTRVPRCHRQAWCSSLASATRRATTTAATKATSVSESKT